MNFYEFSDACRQFVWRLYKLWVNLSPLWITLFLLGTTWANLYHFCWCVLINPSPEPHFGQDAGLEFEPPVNFPLGLSILVISAFLKAVWLGAWVQALVITWFCDRKWRSPTSSKNIMQVDPSIWDRRNPSDRGYWIPYDAGESCLQPFISLSYLLTVCIDRRPRVCNLVGGCRLRMSDRVYHCTRLDRCLPVYDHFCDFIQVAVYLRTMKAYLFVLVFLPLDASFSIAISIYALTRNHRVDIAVTAILAACLVIFTTVRFTYDKLWLLACKNIVSAEVCTN